MRLVGGTSKTEVRGMVTDKIAAPPVVQAAATKLGSDGGRRRESVNKVHKKRSRANKRKRSKEKVLTQKFRPAHGAVPSSKRAPFDRPLLKAVFLKVARQYRRGGMSSSQWPEGWTQLRKQSDDCGGR
jgi:hypothetical protein